MPGLPRAPLRPLVVGVLLLAATGRAAAQPEPEGPARGQESPELAALRAAEREMFAPDRPETPAPGARARAVVGELPAALTSDAPAASPETARGSRDLSWLQGLELPDIPVRWDDRVIRFLEFFRDDPRGNDIIGTWLERTERYGPMIRAQLRDMGLPEDLLYVAMIESGFDPTARSRAGAGGMWQFVPRTGQEYGLEQDHWVDERLDPVKATEAAGRYLGDLKRRFGTWELALAAYNMGYGALLRAIRKYNTNDYWVLARLESGLPFETTIYVAKAMAAAIVGHNPERFGLEALEQQEPLETAVARVPGGVSLRLFARAAGVERDRLAALNPELLRERTPPGRDAYPLRLPAQAEERFAARWPRVRPRHPAHRTYVMRFGEDLDDVADRFRTSARRLQRLNGFEDGAADQLGVGSTLLVPDVEPREAEPPEEPPVVAVPEEPPSYPDRRRVFYRVASQDDIEDVARFFSVTVDEVRRWNHVDAEAALQPGMFLQLFVPPEVDLSRAVVLSEDAVRVLVVGSEEFFDYHERQKGRVRLRYTVRPGDTLVRVARRFGLSVGDVARINRFPRDTELRVGERIVIYANRSDVPRSLLARLEREQDGDEDAADGDDAER